MLICRENKRCKTWCRSKYVEQSCVDLEQRLVEAARAGAVTPMINSLPATWHRQIHHQDQNWIKSRQIVNLLTNWHLQIQHHYRSIKAVCVEGWDKFKLSNFLWSGSEPNKLLNFDRPWWTILILKAKVQISISSSSAQVLRSQMRWSTTGWLGTTSRTGNWDCFVFLIGNWDWWSLLSFSLHYYQLYHRHLGQGRLVIGIGDFFHFYCCHTIILPSWYFLHHRHHGLQGCGRWKDKLPGGKNGDYKEKPRHTATGSFLELYFAFFWKQPSRSSWWSTWGRRRRAGCGGSSTPGSRSMIWSDLPGSLMMTRNRVDGVHRFLVTL